MTTFTKIFFLEKTGRRFVYVSGGPSGWNGPVLRWSTEPSSGRNEYTGILDNTDPKDNVDLPVSLILVERRI